ncbi:MAG TPA: 3-isopropylmalate dehydratase small subunit [Rhodanobacter sp.]
MNVRGRAFVFGDKVDTDVLAPGLYMRGPIEVLASHCLEAIDPEFAREVRPGDVIIAGDSFGIGSSREQAVQALSTLGVGALLAKSFARIFYRNALNLGMPALVCPQLQAGRGDDIEVRPADGIVINHTLGREFVCQKIPEELLDIVAVGGLMPWLERKLARERAT